eukprot:TRINITY_DN47294_c0_g1_i1.p1 TRINITY_DN47294_c0_g1~~TRINITY_DN47294_c0_g1_i1.p1  ORF type:complete len:592 (-),score=108.44 TRINITY_DN47294_c0_g1_i1:714-2489(-)
MPRIPPELIQFTRGVGTFGQRWAEALEALLRLLTRDSSGGGGLKPDLACYNAFLGQCVRAGGQWRPALAMLAEAGSKGQQQQEKGAKGQCGLQLDVVSYSAVVSSCERVAAWDRSLGCLCEMNQLGLETDATVMNAANAAASRGKEWEKSTRCLHVALQMSLRHDCIAFGSAISSSARGLQWPLAHGLLSEVARLSLESSLIACGATLTALTAGLQWLLAAVCLENMQRRRINPDERACSAALGACAARGAALESATSLLASFETAAVEPAIDSYAAAVAACAPQRAWVQALNLGEATSSAGLLQDEVSKQLAVWNRVADACVDEWPCALQLLTRWGSQQVQPTLVSYNSLLVSLLGSGEVQLLGASACAAQALVLAGFAQAALSGSVPSLLELAAWKRPVEAASAAASICDHLQALGSLSQLSAAVLARCISSPVLAILLPSQERRGGKKPRALSAARLRDPLLEHVPGLSAQQTEVICRSWCDEGASTEAFAWASSARRASRLAYARFPGFSFEANADPRAGDLAASIAASLGRRSSPKRCFAMGHGDPDDVYARSAGASWLPAVFVEHDRSPHAERIALVACLRGLLL